MKNEWLNRLIKALTGVALCAGLLAPASAVIVTTSYDPPFGAGPLEGYGWNATINYELPAECFASSGPKVRVGGFVLFCGDDVLQADFKVLSAQVGIYAMANPNFLLDVLTFNPASLPLLAVVVQPPDALVEVYAWTPSNIVRGNQSFDDDIQFRLKLFGEAAEVQYRECAVGVSNSNCPTWRTTEPSVVTNYTRYAEGTAFSDVFAQTELRLGVQAVPEPGTLALALLALGTGLASTRRRR